MAGIPGRQPDRGNRAVGFPLHTMFLCVSANPAIDKRMRIGRWKPGAVNRAIEAVPEPGGKAAHVAMALRAFGVAPVWIGFAGGPNGTALLEGLTALGIRARAVPTEQPTRENLSIVDHAGGVTEILEPGGSVSAKELARFREACGREFRKGKGGIVVLSGSLPPGVPGDLYAELIRSARSCGCRVFLDSSGEALRRGLAEEPDLVKPNREEAESLTGKKIADPGAGPSVLRAILERGARSVALSLGREGLLWCPGAGRPVLHARASAVAGRSAVGSGDATMAGFAVALAGGKSEADIVRRAAACGTANVLADSPGRIRLSDVRRIEKTVRIETLGEAARRRPAPASGER